MSRIGLKPVAIPQGVKVSSEDKQILVEGPKGVLRVPVNDEIKYVIETDAVRFERQDDLKKTKSQHGLTRALLQNAVLGVTQGYALKLEVNGVGFKVQLSGKVLKLSLGFSHELEYQIPDGVTVVVEANNIAISGADKQQVGQVAAGIRSLKPPEPYKGKGIKYSDEQIMRKSGKSAAVESAS